LERKKQLGKKDLKSALEAKERLDKIQSIHNLLQKKPTNLYAQLEIKCNFMACGLPDPIKISIDTLIEVLLLISGKDQNYLNSLGVE